LAFLFTDPARFTRIFSSFFALNANHPRQILWLCSFVPPKNLFYNVNTMTPFASFHLQVFTVLPQSSSPCKSGLAHSPPFFPVSKTSAVDSSLHHFPFFSPLLMPVGVTLPHPISPPLTPTDSCPSPLTRRLNFFFLLTPFVFPLIATHKIKSSLFLLLE